MPQQKFLQPSLFWVFAFLLTLTSCGESLKEKEGSLGKESAPSDVQEAINESLKGISIGNAKTGDHVVYIENLRVELGAVMLRKKYDQSVTRIEVDKEKKLQTFELEQTLTTYENDIPVDIKTSAFSIYEPLAAISSAKSLQTEFIKTASFACDGVDETDNQGHTYDCVKYFNLIHQKRLVAPPEMVQAKPNCMNIPNCLMPIDYLQYDFVKWSAGRAVYKYTLMTELAPTVPDLLYEQEDGQTYYTPASLSFCIKGTQVYQGTAYTVTSCKILRDFDIPSGE